MAANEFLRPDDPMPDFVPASRSGVEDPGFSEIFGASVEAMRATDITTSRTDNQRTAFNEVKRALVDVYGGEQAYLDKLRATEPDELVGVSDEERVKMSLGAPFSLEHLIKMRAMRNSLSPEQKANVPDPDRVWQRGREIALERYTEAAAVMERAEGFGEGSAVFLGGMTGAMTDPANIAAMIAFRRPISTFRGAVVYGAATSGATEAALQPVIQQYREEVGLPSGWDVGLTNVMYATVGGSVFGAVEGSLIKLWQAIKVRRRKGLATQVDEQIADLLERYDAGELDREGLNQEFSALAEREPAFAAAIEISERAAQAQAREVDNPFGLSPEALEAHRARLANAEASILDEPIPFDGDTLPPAPAQARVQDGRGPLGLGLKQLLEEDDSGIAKVVEGYSAAAVAADEFGPDVGKLVARSPDAPGAPDRPTSLIDWLRQRGGIRDDTPFMQGEVRRVLGGDPKQRPGLVNNQSGETLDVLARAAAEDGFDVPGQDPQRLLRLIEEEIGGNPVFRIGEREVWDAWQEELAKSGGRFAKTRSRSGVSESELDLTYKPFEAKPEYRLNPNEAKAVEMALNGYPNAIIGEELQIADGSVPVLLNRARNKLRPHGIEVPKGYTKPVTKADRVLALLGLGLDAKTIAERLGTTPKFVHKTKSVAKKNGLIPESGRFSFTRARSDALASPAELSRMDTLFVRDNATVFQRALREAAACAGGVPMKGMGAAVAGGVLGIGIATSATAAVLTHGSEDARDARRSEFFETSSTMAEERAERDRLATARFFHNSLVHGFDRHRAMREQAAGFYRENLDELNVVSQFHANIWAEKLTGVSGDFLDDLIMKESAGDWEARPPEGSAYGGAQFIESTWRRMMRKHGPSYGLKLDPYSKDKSEREAVLEMRSDRKWGTVIAAEYTRENAEEMERVLRRPVTQKEAYLGHFLGARDALRALRADRDTIAAEMFPRAAKNNHNVFYKTRDESSPRTIGEMITRQGRGFSSKPLLAPRPTFDEGSDA